MDKQVRQIIRLFFFVSLCLPVFLPGQEFMMQGWYWDYPKTPDGANWANNLEQKAQELSDAGFTDVWLPPFSRASFGSNSNGYDPKDLYDLGEYGGGPTGFGSRTDVNNLITAFNNVGINAVADVVYNHRDGGAPENNPAVAGWIRNMTFAKIENGDQPYPSDRFRLVLPIGGNTGLGTGTYFFKVGSRSGHPNFHNKPYKVYMETNTKGFQGLPNYFESEPNGGGGCFPAEQSDSISLGVDMFARIDDSGCLTDEFSLKINAGDYNPIGDFIYIYLNNRDVGGMGDYSDHTVLELFYTGGGGNLESQIIYQTYTDFTNLPSGQGGMNYLNFRPNGNPTQLAGDFDAMLFFYDYDQSVQNTRDVLFDWTKWLWNDVGIRGYRLDAVKHFPPDFVGDLLDDLHDNGIAPGMVVGEFFDGNAGLLSGWINSVYANMDDDTKAAILPRVFDFSLRNALEAASDAFGYDARNVFNASLVDAAGTGGFNVVTFVDNHDFRDPGSRVDNDPILAYAYILTNNQAGLPCVFYDDYYNKGLKPQIDQLIDIHKNYIFGAGQRDYLSRFGTPYAQNFTEGLATTTLLYQLSGAVNGKDVIVAINYAGENLDVLHGVNITTLGISPGDQLVELTGHSPAGPVLVNANGEARFQLGPRSYGVWVVDNASQKPVANAGPDQVIDCAPLSGASVTLDGSASFDPNSNPLTYLWQENGQTIGTGVSPAVTLAPGVHLITLIVDNGAGSTDDDQVQIIVNADTQAPVLGVPSAPVVVQPSSVAIPGNFQSELGCPGDWQPDCAVTELTFDAEDEVWQGTFTIPAGSWEYKAALNDSWDVNYGANAQQDGANILLNLGSQTDVKFYYDRATNWVTDNINSRIVTAPGNYQSEIGCSGDWQPWCLRSWLQDPDGDGIYTQSFSNIPAGNYEVKAAINESWDENYGANGQAGGDNIPFSVSPNDLVTFSFNSFTNLLTVTTAPNQDLSCPGPQTVYATADACGLVPDLISLVSAFDNCSIPVISQSPLAGAPFGSGNNGDQTVVIITADDGNGNTATCQVTVTLEDEVAPVPDVAALPNVTGECPLTVSAAPTATDACAGTVTGTTDDPLTYTEQGTYTITWTYADGNGNSATQTQTVVVADMTAPMPDVATLPTVTGECSATVSAVPTATDACAGTVTGTTDDPLTYTEQGTYTITWTYADGNGNSATQTQTVVVEDMTAPVPDLATLSTVTGECSATVSAAPTATDACAGTVTGTTDDPLTYTEQGTYTITWTYSDGNGNSGTQTQTVIVEDMTAPVPDLATLSTVTGECSATVSTVPTATDACAGTVTGITNDPLMYTEQGLYTITWTYADGNGNSATQTQTVIVADGTAPTPDVATLPTVTGECFATVSEAPTATDVCAGTVTGTTDDPLTYTEQGTYTITWTYADGNGNSATQTQTVVVEDMTAPVPAAAILPTVTGECSATVSAAPTAMDACAGAVTGTTDDPLTYTEQGTYTITWTYADGNGNSSTQTQTVVVADATAPVPDLATLSTVMGECSATVSTVPTATDACAGTVTGTTNDPLTYTEQGTYTITWIYADGNGNSSTQTQTVVVNDVTPPAALCQHITVQLDDFGNASITAAEVDAGSNDACGIASLSIDVNSFDCYELGDHPVVLTATDNNGLSGTCVAVVTVEGPDADCDGVADICDVCPGGDDKIDYNEDGLPDCANFTDIDELLPEWRCHRNDGKILICHLSTDDPDSRQTLCLPPNAVQEHLDHGDYLGPCDDASCGEGSLTFVPAGQEAELSSDNRFKLYPNPARGFAVVDLIAFGEEQLTLTVFNQLSQPVRLQRIDAGAQQQVTIDLSGLSGGLYLVNLRTEDGQTWTRRLVVTGR